MATIRNLLWVLVLFFSGCMSSEINSKQVDSPDGKYRAYAFVADGGATTDWTPQVSLVKKGFLTFRPLKANTFSCTGSNQVDVRWVSNETLVIVSGCIPFPSAQRILLQKSKVEGVNVKYEFLTNGGVRKR